MSEITGGYPGGPPRHAEQEGAGPELAHGESVEDRRVEQGASFRKERRQKRLMIGLVISLLAAASAGAYYGIQQAKRRRACPGRELEQAGRGPGSANGSHSQ